MRVTGPTKERTKKLAAELEKAGRKSKKALWLEIAGALRKPRRQRPSINLWKISKLSKIFGDKHLLVPGKVLGYGELHGKASVIAFEFSGDARKKIAAAGGNALSIEEALAKKVEPKKIIIAK